MVISIVIVTMIILFIIIFSLGLINAPNLTIPSKSENNETSSASLNVSTFIQKAQKLYLYSLNNSKVCPPDLVNISSQTFLSLKVINNTTIFFNNSEYRFVVLNQSGGSAHIENYIISYYGGWVVNSTITYSGGYPVFFTVKLDNGTTVGRFTHYVIAFQISSFSVFVQLNRIGDLYFLFINYSNCSNKIQSVWIALTPIS
ncbi:hypothetical protein [Sulfurisphaera tokodaii]|uniref:Uncharacterized protein n=2 Tax=Sulfurisphaera tokodaii TaxID=111955 RepID=Q972F3_SULTO|nr:hypothetical protein [Sulfurisphaera tokodaii]BAB66216.1 hypothetical protein STK_11790 [Sulfurisphaera tokodaii str. 7]HII73201.1 hypothetical protein [Sulfurisphaera tokodaii]